MLGRVPTRPAHQAVPASCRSVDTKPRQTSQSGRIHTRSAVPATSSAKSRSRPVSRIVAEVRNGRMRSSGENTSAAQGMRASPAASRPSRHPCWVRSRAMESALCFAPIQVIGAHVMEQMDEPAVATRTPPLREKRRRPYPHEPAFDHATGHGTGPTPLLPHQDRRPAPRPFGARLRCPKDEQVSRSRAVTVAHNDAWSANHSVAYAP